MRRHRYNYGCFLLVGFLLAAFIAANLLAAGHASRSSAALAEHEGEPGPDAGGELSQVADPPPEHRGKEDHWTLTVLYFVAIVGLSGVAGVGLGSLAKWLRG